MVNRVCAGQIAKLELKQIAIFTFFFIKNVLLVKKDIPKHTDSLSEKTFLPKADAENEASFCCIGMYNNLFNIGLLLGQF